MEGKIKEEKLKAVREKQHLIWKTRKFERQWVSHQKPWRPEGNSTIRFRYEKKRTVNPRFFPDFIKISFPHSVKISFKDRGKSRHSRVKGN